MAKKRYYAIRKGKKTGIFDSWDECEKYVKGYSGAEYKGFSNRKEAEVYYNTDDAVMLDTDVPESGQIIAYVDGSYDAEREVYGFGYVLLLPDGKELKCNGAGNNKESALLRNVTGEMLGAMHAVRYAIQNGYSSVQICYDYLGIEMWATDKWQTNTELTAKYAETMKKWADMIGISFKKVAAHTNVKYNEIADELAKEAVKNFL